MFVFATLATILFVHYIMHNFRGPEEELKKVM